MQIQFIYVSNGNSLSVHMDSCPRKDEIVITPDGEYKIEATEHIIGGSSSVSGVHIKTVVWLVPS